MGITSLNWILTFVVLEVRVVLLGMDSGIVLFETGGVKVLFVASKGKGILFENNFYTA
jgi:hypothetical protein